MLFNSFQFLQFLLVIGIVFFMLPFRLRMGFLLVSSYYFYGCWNVDYLVLIFTTTASTYAIGRVLGRTEGHRGRQALVFLVCLINFGILGFFKYFNFFAESWNVVSNVFTVPIDIPLFDFLLPVGISFYTFQAIGYVIDIYRNRVEPETNLVRFALYISFFPQLVAGPIERSWQLLPQFTSRLRFNYQSILHGTVLILWGFFQKVVIADRLAIYVDNVFKLPGDFNCLQIIVALYFFAFQIYCDFAGYSNIAIGSAKLFGIDLMNNFNRPYFSSSIQSFWRKWHISLSTWFKDYLYIPLGGNRVHDTRLLGNLMIVFLLCGLWHGAAWNFVIWGGIHGLLCCSQVVVARQARMAAFLGSIPRVIKVMVTFHVVTLAWVFFRSTSLSNALQVIDRLAVFDIQLSQLLTGTGLNGYEFTLSVILIATLILVEKMQKVYTFDELWAHSHFAWRVIVPELLFFSILVFGVFDLSEFIYFQF